MEIAGAVVCVQPLFQSTREYCKAYLTDKPPEYFVEITREDLSYEQELLDREADEQGLKHRVFKEPFRERSVIQRRVADHLSERSTLMLHGSTVSVDGKAYLFTAPCGTGKSTHTRLWREVFVSRAVMVNDDKPFLRITPFGVLAYGSPWSGKHGLSTNVCVPLKGICALARGRENRIRRSEPQEMMEILRQQVHIPEEDALAQKVLDLLDVLSENVPLWSMECNMDPNAARVSFSAMSGGSE